MSVQDRVVTAAVQGASSELNVDGAAPQLGMILSSPDCPFMSVQDRMVTGAVQYASSEFNPDEGAPQLGMIFSSPDAAFEFYKVYSRRVGFGVTRRTSHNFYGIKYDVTFACNKNRKSSGNVNEEGFSSRNRGVLGTGCKARIVLRDRLLRGIWTVEEVVLDHNHDLAPDAVRLMRCHRTIPLFVKKQLEINELAGLAQNKSISAVFTQTGGVTKCNFTEKDMRNYIAEVRRLQLSKGDAAALMEYFRVQQDRSPYFYYSYNIDDDGRLKNVFWADARSRAAYKYFGDVVTFDTTYLTNRYRMPFAVFVGVNHHGQSILLGCALLSNELTETFEWCFTTFLSCMHGKPPDAIITDQCGAICGALREVMETTRHRLCLWHILKKVPEKLAGIRDKDLVMQEICTAVYESRSPQEFESRWIDMLSNFNLGRNTHWFEELYQMKEKWVPAYVMNSFWAGMSTTQRSESMNAFFDKYVNSRTSLKSFVQKYDTALHAKWEKERQEDFRCMQYTPKLITGMEIEKQFAGIYTLKLFYFFQQEIKSLIGCFCLPNTDQSDLGCYDVTDISQPRPNQVIFDRRKNELTCSCRLFEFRGIVCRHILCVCKQAGIERLPDKYISSRWCKNYKRSYLKLNVPPLPVLRDVNRYSEAYSALNQIMLDMVEVASTSSSLLEYLLARMTVFKKELIEISEKEEPAKPSSNESSYDSSSSTQSVNDPLLARSKGRPRSKRLQPVIEMVANKKKRTTNKFNNQVNEAQQNETPARINLLTSPQTPCPSNVSTPSDGNTTPFQNDVWRSATDLLMHFQAASHERSPE